MTLTLNCKHLAKLRLLHRRLLLAWCGRSSSALHLSELLHHLCHVVRVHSLHLRLTGLLQTSRNLRLCVLLLLEHRVWTLHQRLLSLVKHGHQRLSHRRAHEELWQVHNVFGNSLANQQLCALVSEVVAVVGQNIVSAHLESRRNVAQQLHENILSDLGDSQIYGLGRSSYKEI